MLLRIPFASICFFLAVQTAAEAGICDYRPSQFIGGKATAAVAGGSAATAATGSAMQIAGFYTLTNATTGATMLASTAAGASAAGTTGIIAGTSGAIGTASAVVMTPVVIGSAVVVALGVGGLEGVCFFKDERITDYDELNAIMANMGEHADKNYFRYLPFADEGRSKILLKRDGEWEEYDVEDLYIVNGELKARDWGLNTAIGNVGFIRQDVAKR